MILFKKEFIPLILSGKKYQTRRLWLNLRAKPGTYHWAQTSLKPETRFAKLYILRAEEWDGEMISMEDVRAEGFETEEEFWQTFNQLNTKRSVDPRRRFYVIEFEIGDSNDDNGVQYR